MSSNSDDEIRFGKCDSCGKALTDDNWCRNCSAKRFKEKFDEWTSGNDVIDKFIRQIQLKAISHHKVLEWIPFEDIPNEDEGERIEHIADGGHGSVYKAKWKLGPIVYYDNDNQEWHRAGKTDIVLKSINALNDTNNIPDKFFEEIEAQMTSFVEFGYIIRCFGVTKCSNSNQYLMVMDYKKDGSLHDYLYKNFKRIRWKQKLDIVYFAIKGLSEIHDVELMHKDFHSGNIIISDGVSYISDFGLCQNVSSKAEKQIFGVLPYVDPEVLREKPYTQASDIYSFGIVMNQVAIGYKPYHDIPHDNDLVFKIACNKIRPDINEKITPKIIVNLIKRCWSEDPGDRPTANELLDELFFCRQKDHEIWSEIESIEKNMNFDIAPEKASLDYKTLASYTSQLITVSQEIASDTSKRISVSSIPDS